MVSQARRDRGIGVRRRPPGAEAAAYTELNAKNAAVLGCMPKDSGCVGSSSSRTIEPGTNSRSSFSRAMSRIGSSNAPIARPPDCTETDQRAAGAHERTQRVDARRAEPARVLRRDHVVREARTPGDRRRTFGSTIASNCARRLPARIC